MTVSNTSDSDTSSHVVTCGIMYADEVPGELLIASTMKSEVSITTCASGICNFTNDTIKFEE